MDPGPCKPPLSEQSRIVVLIRHSISEVDADRPASEWPLSEEGIARCQTLASDLRRLLPATLLSSPEIKAVQTAERIGFHLGLGFSVRDGLREHRRTATFLPQSEFHDNIRNFFQSQASVVYGSESCHDVAARLESEIRHALSERTDGNIMMVTHGTAMTSFASRHAATDAYSLWKSLDLPAYIALSVPSFGIVDSAGAALGQLTAAYPRKPRPEPET